MTHALDLPEVKSHIAQFLTPYDLTVCSRVSQDWNQACLPFLWQKLKVTRPSHRSSRDSGVHGVVDKASVRRHSHHLRILRPRHHSPFGNMLAQPSTVDVRDVYFQNLEDLTWRALPHDQAIFIQCHRLTLVRLDLSCQGMQSEPAQRESEELWRVLAACPKLKSLKIASVCVSHTTWPVCWSLWSRLTYLGLVRVDFSALLTAGASDKPENTLQKQPASIQEWLSQANACHQPLRIKTLDINHHHEMRRLEDELAFLRYCPDLKTLIWCVDGKKYTPELSAQHLTEQTRHCTKLVDVTIRDGSQSNIVVPFLETKVGLPLQGLCLSFFGQAAWDLVRTKYATSLRSIDLWNAAIPDGLANDMLCNLPSLVSASVNFFKDQDFTNDFRPWVCLGLKRLVMGVFVEGDPLQVHHLIMRRLGTLTSLNYLKVSSGGRNPLLFRLRSGLGHLATLRKLQELQFHNSPQSLQEDDARWMLNNWPWFDFVMGELTRDRTTYSSLKRILKEGGVAVRYPDDEVLIRETTTTTTTTPPRCIFL